MPISRKAGMAIAIQKYYEMLAVRRLRCCSVCCKSPDKTNTKIASRAGF
jgi:hypothetical protein